MFVFIQIAPPQRSQEVYVNGATVWHEDNVGNKTTQQSEFMSHDVFPCLSRVNKNIPQIDVSFPVGEVLVFDGV